MKVSIVIPNYNGASLLKKNLPEVLKVSMLADEIIIVDDASTDGSVKGIRNQESGIRNQGLKTKIKLIINNKNLGFAGTVNRGVAEASGDIVVLLNTDVVPKENYLTPFIKHFEDKGVFAVGCLDESVEKEGIVRRGRGLGKFERGFLIHSRGEADKSNTLWISGGSGAFRKEIWIKLGGMSTLYNPFYWEDIDLSYRGVKSGFKILFEPESIVIHRHNEGAIKSKFSDAEIKKIAYRNQLIFVWKNITDPDLLLQHLVLLPYHILQSLIRLDFPFLSGLTSALYKLPEVLSERRKVATQFILKDREVISKAAK
ncbi:MAG: Glycosyl transferase, family 2 [Candidatus Gottesmanbacteria bacterium GW2011_GWC2_39_8]|uniref:Glycosyl transferase, family 2 n=1 Tax=Candidatus Gottesmanbacteria bacterium GW2011_GWC2_39_8 TaxID=1618450 RepID=A0A0G0T8W6_9BACT|nr:MAG: Glycosyl transferase, family 2 [Candidatus Gottesmanbacteria bacterium GW2011_GWC2_39_8]